MVNYEEAIKRPFTDWKSFFIASAMYVVPFLNIITQFFATGFIIKSLANVRHKDYTLPEFTDWGDLFLVGLLSTAIGLVYSIPALVFALIGGLSFKTDTLALPISMIVLAAVFALLALFVTPSALVSYSEEDRFGAGFAFGRVLRRAFTWTYLKTWLVGFVYLIVLTAISAFISAVTAITFVVPIIVSAVYSYVLGMTFLSMLAEACGELPY